MKIILVIAFIIAACCANIPEQKEQRVVKLYRHTAHSILTAYEKADPKSKKKLKILLDHPMAIWLGDWAGNPETYLKRFYAKGVKGYPVFVLYNIPNRDCGGHSGGGARDHKAYRKWIDNVRMGLGNNNAIFILEPDAIAHYVTKGCHKKDVLKSINYAVKRLSNKNTLVYIDAGHITFPPPGKFDLLVISLFESGIDMATGFSLNVSNYYHDALILKQGIKIRKMIKKPFVIDSSRNGAGSNGEWCNPPDRKLGRFPRFGTDIPGLDGYLWIKVPGESDGRCNGGPRAGKFYMKRALELVSR
jgi:endoglucanase